MHKVAIIPLSTLLLLKQQHPNICNIWDNPKQISEMPPIKSVAGNQT